jgi:hypothetical protein
VAAIERFFEISGSEEKTGRSLLKHTKEPMPDPSAQCVWQKDANFSMADELLVSPAFKTVISSVLENGFVIIPVANR